MSPGEVLDEVKRDIPFYENSGGGMTLSGGEALIQGAFALELLSGAKQEGIHTAVETCGFVGKAVWERALMYTDLYLFDCKETNPELHLKYTGAPLLPILENLRLLDERGKRIILRCPIIPTINDREDHFTEIAALANRFSSIEEIVVLPYHTLGVSKYERLRLAYTLSEISPPTEEEILSWIETISAHTETPVKKA